MTEVPEHLLKRAAEARSRMTGEGGGDESSAASAPSAAPPATTPAPAATTPAVPEEPKAPEPVAPYVEAGLTRKTIPAWVIPVLLFLPIWAIYYVGYLERPPSEAAGLLAEGGEVYSVSCAGCHGGTGGGGTGRQLNDGEVLLTFPSTAAGSAFDGLADHVAWVANGTAGTTALSPLGYGDPDRPGGVRVPGSFGQMSGFAGSLSVEELIAAVYYERTVHGGFDEPAAATELAVLDELIVLVDEQGVDLDAGLTAADIQELIDEARSVAGAEGETAAG